MKPITANDVLGLSIPERIRLVGDIWDTIAEVPETLELTDSQRQELDRRLDDLEADIQRGAPLGIPWDEVLQRIRSRPR